MKIEPDAIYGTKEMAEFLKASGQTVTRWCSRGVLPAFKLGEGTRKWYVYGRDLLSLGGAQQSYFEDERRSE